MAQTVLYGAAFSTAVRTIRLCLAEKAVAYDLVPVTPGSPEAWVRHPFGKVPVLEHAGEILFEVPAIAEYIDERFAGRPLRPETPAGRARMRQWMSACADYLYPVAVRRVALPLYVASRGGPEPDRRQIEAAAALVPDRLAPFEAAIDRMSPFLAGAAPSIADYMLYPLLDMVRRVPPLTGVLDGLPRLADWRDRLDRRPSCRDTAPSPDGGAVP